MYAEVDLLRWPFSTPNNLPKLWSADASRLLLSKQLGNSNFVQTKIILPPLSNRDVAVLLLEHDKWKEMLKSFDYKSKTPMRGLIAFMPGKLI